MLDCLHIAFNSELFLSGVLIKVKLASDGNSVIFILPLISLTLKEKSKYEVTKIVSKHDGKGGVVWGIHLFLRGIILVSNLLRS